MRTICKNGMMSILRLALLTTILMAVSCSTESISDYETTDLTAATAKAKKPRPIKNNYVGVDRADGLGSDFSGNMSHVGKYTGQTFTTSFEFNEDFTGGVQTSDDTVVAANGDEIRTKSVTVITFSPETGPGGDQTFSAGTYAGGFDIVGGTGRFEGARGRMDLDNGVFGGGIATHNAEGTITY